MYFRVWGCCCPLGICLSVANGIAAVQKSRAPQNLQNVRTLKSELHILIPPDRQVLISGPSVILSHVPVMFQHYKNKW